MSLSLVTITSSPSPLTSWISHNLRLLLGRGKTIHAEGLAKLVLGRCLLKPTSSSVHLWKIESPVRRWWFVFKIMSFTLGQKKNVRLGTEKQKITSDLKGWDTEVRGEELILDVVCSQDQKLLRPIYLQGTKGMSGGMCVWQSPLICREYIKDFQWIVLNHAHNYGFPLSIHTYNEF